MAGFILVGMLAAFGILCSIWAVAGLLLPGCAGGALVCRGSPGFPERAFVVRYLWLTESGLLRCPLYVVDLGLEEEHRKWLGRWGGRIEIYTPEELASGPELERDRFG